MRSRAPVEPLDTFEIDLPVTAADAAAQQAMRDRNWMSPDEYLAFLVSFTRQTQPERNVSDGPPFEL